MLTTRDQPCKRRLHSNPNAHGTIGDTNVAWNVVQPNYVQIDSNRTAWAAINFYDLGPNDANAGSHPGSVRFPYDTNPNNGAEPNVAMFLRGTLVIPTNGTYWLGFQGDDGSLNWRLIENEYAIAAIKANPWLGLGMGFTYRPWDSRIDQVDLTGTSYDFRKHIHNGHFWILLQSGLLGYLSLIWLSVIFVGRGLLHWRQVQDLKLRSIVIGFVLTYGVVFVAAIANSSFTQWRWTPILGIMMGINEVVIRASRETVDA